MAIDKGNIKTSANYDVRAQKPIDGRSVRPTKADLIKKESWSSDGSTVYVYEGMQVYVQDEKKTYYLKDLSKMFATDFSGWELMGTGAGGSITEEKEVYIGSEEPPVGTKVWIDPQGTPSQPSQPSADNGIRYYVLPEGLAAAWHPSGMGGYIFSAEEAEEFKRVVANWHNYTYVVMVQGYVDGRKYLGTASFVGMLDDSSLDCNFSGPLQDYLSTDAILIEIDDEGNVRA